jgi:hypothetical protein
MCEVRSRKNGQEQQKEKRKKKYSGQQQKEIDCDEPHPAPNEKTQPIQWTERPTGALVAVNSLWPTGCYPTTVHVPSSKSGITLHCNMRSLPWKANQNKKV